LGPATTSREDWVDGQGSRRGRGTLGSNISTRSHFFEIHISIAVARRKVTWERLVKIEFSYGTLTNRF